MNACFNDAVVVSTHYLLIRIEKQIHSSIALFNKIKAKTRSLVKKL